MVDSTSYGFTVEWFDKQADMIREYELTAFEPHQGPLEVAMYDPKARKPFLKRMEIAGVSLKDFKLGSIVSVHARQLKIASYRDDRTRVALEALHEGIAVVTSPALYPSLGKVLESCEASGLRICRFRLVNDNGPVVAIQFAGQDAEARWARVQNTLPEGFAQQVAASDLDAYWNKAKFPTTAAFDNCTLCLVRPHAVKDGGCGATVSAALEADLEISAAEMLQFDRSQAAEMFEVYKGVLPYYADLIDGMSAGPVLALEIRAESGVVEKLRTVVGPHDVDMARYLRPNSLRARLGKDNANNGVHCTDMEEDGEREVSYVFDTLLSRK